jgi:WD40 repeat protein
MATQNPYVGPAPIAEGAPLYGRDDEKRDLYRLLLNERIVLLYSPSGAGKTSLIQAGLMPQLRRDPALRLFRIDGLVDGTEGARLGVTNRYLASLVGQMESALPQEQRGRFDWHAPQASLLGYLDWVRVAGEEGGRRRGEVLLLDHFEDLLLDPYDRQDKQAFFRELGQALTDRSRHALFSMGERNVAELDEYLHLVPTGLARRFRLGLLGRRQARQAITGPAGSLQVRYEPRALAGLMRKLRASIDSRGAGDGRRVVVSQWVEPIQLQIACQRLWATKFPPPAAAAGLIGAADVKAFSVESALEGYYADTVKAAALAAPPTTERDVREWIEDRLILASGARGQAPRGEVGLHLPERATEVLRNEQLVRLQIFGDSRWYELAYDRLVEPVRRNNQRWFTGLAPLQRKTREWVRANRPDRLLMSVPEFLGEWRWRRAHGSELRPDEREFWRRSWRMRVLPAGGALAFVALAGWGWMLWVGKEAATQRAQVETAARKQQQMLVKLGRAKELALERSLDSALIEGVRTANEVEQLPRGPERDRLDFYVRESLMAILRTARNVRKVIIHDDVQLKAVAVAPERADALFAYGGAGGKVMFAGVSGVIPKTSEVRCSKAKGVKSLAFNRNGTLLAVGCEDGTVAVWSSSTWKRLGEWQAHKGRTLTVAFNQSGTAVASGGEGDNSVKVMPLTADGAAAIPVPRTLKVRPTPGSRVPPTPGQAKEQEEISGGVWTVAFSPASEAEGVLVASDGVGGLWLCDAGVRDECELKRPGRPHVPSGWNDAEIAVAFSPDGKCIATGSWKGAVTLWDSNLKFVQELEPSNAPAYSLVFTRIQKNDSLRLAIGRASRLSFVGVSKIHCRASAAAPSAPAATGSPPADDQAAGARAGAGSPLVGDQVAGLAYHVESNLLAAVTGDYLALIDLGRPLERIRIPPSRPSPSVRADASRPLKGWRGALASETETSSRFVVAGWQGALSAAYDPEKGYEVDHNEEDKIFVVEVKRAEETNVDKQPVIAKQGGVIRVTASAVSNRVATLGADGSIKFWKLAANLEEDKSLSALPDAWDIANRAARSEKQPEPFAEDPNDPKERKPTRILLSPDGSLLACLFSGKRGVLMIDLVAPAASRWLPTEKMAALEIAFSSDGTAFAAARDAVLVWDVSGRQLKPRNVKEMSLSGPARRAYELALATTGDGRSIVIAAGDSGHLLVWDARSGELLQTLHAGSQPVEQIAFLPANRLLATADKFGRVMLWDTADWQSIALTTRFEMIQTMRFLSFAGGGRLLVSGSDDLTAWVIDKDALRNKICDILVLPGVTDKSLSEACPNAPQQR